MADLTQKNIIDLIKRSNKILLLPSSPPDGDSLGSAMALYLIFKKLNKEATVICSDPVPEVFDFLPNMKFIGTKLASSTDFIITIDCKKAKIDKIKNTTEDDKVDIIITPKEGQFSEEDISFNKGKLDYDLIITVDTAELTQLKDVYEKHIEIFHQIPVINIDHHISNTHFGKINYVDIMAASTTELLLPLLEELARQENAALIDEDIATLLLTGIITDTGSFQNANTTPRAFERASQLIAYGARQQEIIQYIYKTKQLSQLKLWGRVLSKIQTDEKHRIVWSAVSQQDFRDTGSIEDETGDIIDELMTNAPGAEVILLIKEKKDHSVSVSIRTTTASVDASRIAEIFGGGGHTQAAGCQLSNIDLIEAEYKIISTVRKFQAENLKLDEVSHENTSSVESLMEQAKMAQPQAIQSEPQQQPQTPQSTELKPEPVAQPTVEQALVKKIAKKETSEFKPKTPVIQQAPAKPAEIKPATGYKFED